MKKFLVITGALLIFSICHAQNVGVGTSTPLTKLHVQKGISNGSVLSTSTIAAESNSTNWIHLVNPNENDAGIISGTNLTNLRSGIIFDADSAIRLRAGGNFTRLYIANQGNIGLNTLAPAARLHLRNTAVNGPTYPGANLILENNGDNFLQFSNASTSTAGIISGSNLLNRKSAIIFDPDSGIVLSGGRFSEYYPDPSELHFPQLYISKHGNVGIGTKNPDPSAVLHIESHPVWDNGFLVTGLMDLDPPALPPLGAGTRLMFYPANGVFCVGRVSGTQWNMPWSTMECISIGFDAVGNGYRSVAIGSEISTNNREGAFIIGDNSTTNVENAIADNSFTARFAGGYRLFTNSATSVGVQVAAGGNAWTTISDFNRKENFAHIKGEDFLQKIRTMNLVSWNYKGQDPKVFRHYGPMAQEFFAAFGKDRYGTIGNDTTINQADFDGVNLIAIQALEKRTADLQKENTELRARLERLEKLLGTKK